MDLHVPAWDEIKPSSRVLWLLRMGIETLSCCSTCCSRSGSSFFFSRCRCLSIRKAGNKTLRVYLKHCPVSETQHRSIWSKRGALPQPATRKWPKTLIIQMWAWVRRNYRKNVDSPNELLVSWGFKILLKVPKLKIIHGSPEPWVPDEVLHSKIGHALWEERCALLSIRARLANHGHLRDHVCGRG